jgi:NAD(P)H-hydrate epimerase
MIVLSRSEMQNLDLHTTKEIGIPARILMEHAGYQCARYIVENITGGTEKVAVMCGTGNNGGDGFVVARWLHNDFLDVKVFVFGDIKKMSPETKANYDLCLKLEIPVFPVKKLKDWEELEPEWEDTDLIVDAIYGIGFKPPLKNWMADVIEEINDLGVPVVSIDIPSGVDADTGMADAAIMAHTTLTMDYPKYGHYLGQGRELSGEVVEMDIGIPTQLHWKFPAHARIVDEHTVVFPDRFDFAHKGDYGRVGIIAGSPGYSGAAILASRACLRAGAGLITLFHPAGMDVIFETQLVEVMKCAVPLDSKKKLDWDEFLPRLLLTDVLLIGPGIGFSAAATALVEYVCQSWDNPAVLDADALTLLSMHPEWLELLRDKPVVLTPHIGEFARLLGVATDAVSADPLGHLERFWDTHHVPVLLKSATTVFYNGAQFIFNITGNDGLATGGSGDVLAGIITSFLAQGLPVEEAAPSAAYLLGVTAEEIAEERDTPSVIPSDIIDNLFRYPMEQEDDHAHHHE